MQHAIMALRPVDTFNVITFESRTGQLFESARPANDTHIKAAMEFIDGLRAGGGTLMGKGVEAALRPSQDVGNDPRMQTRHRYVFMMTDGYIGHEKIIFRETRKMLQSLEGRGQKARVFAFGTGSSVNRHLLEGVAKAGKGLAVYASTRQDPTLAVDRFFHLIDRPVLENISIDWGGMQVEDVQPPRIPDLFASRPITIHGRYKGTLPESITLQGSHRHRAIRVPLEIQPERHFGQDSEQSSVIGTLWARAKIAWLQGDLAYNGHNSQVVDAITRLGIGHRIVTAFTSFVAVDRSRQLDGVLKTVNQPVETPEGVDLSMAGGRVMAHKSLAPKGSGRFYRGGGAGSGSIQGYGSVSRKRISKSVRSKARPYKRIRSAAVEIAPSEGSRADLSTSPSAEAPAKDLLSGQVQINKKQGRRAPYPEQKLKTDPNAQREAILRLIKKHERSLQRCIARVTAKHGLRSAKITLKWFVSGTGNLMQLRIVRIREPQGIDSNALLSKTEMQRCLRSTMSRWAFPGSTDGRSTEVIYQLDFQSE